MNNLGHRKLAILAYIKMHPEATLFSVSDAVGIGYDSIKEHISTLKEKRLVENKGSSKYPKWTVVGEASDILEFLLESNYIEKETSDIALEQSLYAWDFLTKQQTLTPQIIKQTQKTLFTNLALRPDQRGYWRYEEVSIWYPEMKERKYAPSYKNIPAMIDDWLPRANYVRQFAEASPSTVEDYIKSMHIEFESIHPFADGNGRVGRMILNWHRLQANLPILIIKASERDKYLQWFEREVDNEKK